MRRHLVLGSTLLMLFSGCSRDAARSNPAEQDSSEASAPTDLLAELDQRAPVPLLPMMANHQKANMRDHLVAVEQIVAALASNDYAGVEKAARRIGFSDETGQMCTHMGSGAPTFAEQALAFHHTADSIVAAAKVKDPARVLSALSATLQACTSCHSTWKQRVVDEATWQRVTSKMTMTSDH